MTKAKVIEEKTPVEEGSLPTEPIIPAPLTSPELELVTLQEKLAKAEKDIEETRALAKKHEQAATRNANKLQQQQELVNLIATQKEEIGVIRDAVMELIDREEGSITEPPPARRSDKYLSRFKTAETKPPAPAIDPEIAAIAQEIDSLAKSVGLTMGKSKELAPAMGLFYQGSPEEALDEVKKVVEGKKTVTQTVTTKPQLTEAEEEEIARKVAERKGRLVSDISVPSGSVTSDAEFIKKFGSGELPMTKANVDRYNKIT